MKNETAQKQLVGWISFFWISLSSLVAQAEESPQTRLSLDDNRPIKLQELAFGEVLYDYYQQNYFAALTRLDVAETRQEVGHHRVHLQLMRGVMYLSYGMLNSAEQIFEQILTDESRSDIINQVRFYLGKTQYMHGNLEQSLNYFSMVNIELPTNLEQEKRLIMAQIAFEMGQIEKAVELLKTVDPETQAGQYATFNLAVFLLRQDQVDGAIELFDRLYPNRQSSDVERSLYDRANLALGYYFLEKKQIEPAQQHLLNVRLDSLYSHRALLALGWTYYESGQEDKAVAHWLELDRRDPREPAVQEAKMALAFAYYRNGAKKEALEAFVNAAASFGEQLNLIAQAKVEMDQEIFQKWLDERGIFGDKVFAKWASGDVPVAGKAIEYYFQEVVASNEFNQFFQRFQETSHLMSVLQRWQRQLPVYQQMLSNHELRYQTLKPKVAERQQQLIQGEHLEQFQALKRQAEQRLQSDDLWVLADEEELELRADLQRVKNSLEKLKQAGFDMEDQEEQWRRIYGALLWKLGVDYGPRRYQLEKGVADAGAAIDELTTRNISLSEAEQKAASRFANYDQRIIGLQQRIEQMLQQIELQKLRSQEQMRQVLEKKLKKREQELDFLLAQTELSIAKIQDEAVNRLLENTQ
ncbi:tetratricopeptide repeat protein [Pleionea litopenaei]|uniref:Tetratricopeptide repeat protein n=1 Tax=Pleionea litopenaei TaxID=3070815 RepID=A0AA51RTW1_9GAMM|nr:tetratricopeptide repeat protein [Pleionea sp. HL-JVS1]WMS87425.1 tetratricopeptide repeat protein [Pleionea sp. HL-JVS1]